jgi:hypothetical protein
MKKRALIVSLALFLGLPAGLVFGASPASAQCYVENSEGGWDHASNFQDPESCRIYAGGQWW